MKPLKAILLILCILPTIVIAQTSNSEQRYKDAMQNAKTAFDAKMYSDALYFYREALKIKPDAKLPRYKIEDIRTIYIDENLKEITETQTVEQPEAKQQAETKADEQIEAEVIKATSEMETLKLVANVMVIDEEPIETEENIEVDELIQSRQVLALSEMEQKSDAKIESKDTPKAEIKKVDRQPFTPEPAKPQVEEKTEPENPQAKAMPEPKVVAEKPKAKPAPQPVSKPKQMTDEEREAWIEAEQEKLRQQYPEQKTVLEIDQPGKHITRVIMNIDNKISIYLKVKHSWGATFYFEEVIGLDNLQSINEIYFNKMTNLATYGH